MIRIISSARFHNASDNEIPVKFCLQCRKTVK